MTDHEAAAQSAGPAPLDRFVRLCVPLTGFTAYELRSTGMAQLYFDTARREIGHRSLDAFLGVWEEAHQGGLGPSRLPALERELARALIYLWYTGAFPRIAPAAHAELRRDRPNQEFVASPESYPEGLVWRAFGGHPAGAKPPGFGTWGDEPPVLPTEAEIAARIAAEGAGPGGAVTYDADSYGSAGESGGSTPAHLLPGPRSSRAVSPSAVPPASSHPVRETSPEAGE